MCFWSESGLSGWSGSLSHKNPPIAVAASHLDWTSKPDALGPLGWVVTATAIATGTALVVPPIRRVALGLIERAHYAAAIVWLLVVAASIV